jgi:predicted nucleotidyltransferase
MGELDELAADVQTSGRTLRRAAARGTLRARRVSARKVVVPVGERLYVRRHWPLLATLIQTLRTQPNVRLAALFGSAARGEQSAGSDLDIAVSFRRDDHQARADLAELLERASGRSVQLVSLDQAEESPLLLADLLHDGRVLVDRDGEWRRLKRSEPTIVRRAREQDAQLETAAWEAPAALERIRRRRTGRFGAGAAQSAP